MEQNYFLISNEGTAFALEGKIDLVQIQKILNTPQNVAVRLGRKVVSKFMIYAVAKNECSDMEEYNLGITVGQSKLRTNVEDIETILDALEADINKMDYVMINDAMLIFKHAFQVAEAE